MPELQTHIALVKELVKENPKLFTTKDLKYLIQGAIFPDIYYITGMRTLATKPNFSKFIHETEEENYGLGKLMLQNAKIRPEKLFAIGFISHFILDKRIHNYLKKIGYYKDMRHMASEYYLDTKFPDLHIPIPRFPLKLIKTNFEKYYPKDYKTYKNEISVSIKGLLFHDFVNRFIVDKIINKRYRKEHYSTRLSILSLPFKLARLSKYKKMGYDYTILLNPDSQIKRKDHLDAMYKEYLKAKKETIDFIMEYEFNVQDYSTKQTEIRDFLQ